MAQFIHRSGQVIPRLGEVVHQFIHKQLAATCHHRDLDPADVYATAVGKGLEGVVCKRLASTYQPGRRSPDLVKVPSRSRGRSSLSAGRPVPVAATG
jgi:ATP-dependent DNA ligase